MTTEARVFTSREIQQMAEKEILLSIVAGAVKYAMRFGHTSDRGVHYDIRLSSKICEQVIEVTKARTEEQP